MDNRPYLTLVKTNYGIIERSGISDSSLTRYFDACFSDVIKLLGLYKCWVCVACGEKGPVSLGWGDKPPKCEICGSRVYEVATFNARAEYVGDVFEYACIRLLKSSYSVETHPTQDSTRLYDFEIVGRKHASVVEAKGSPHYLNNPDGSKSSLDRPGMCRTDTEKKAFANAESWRKRFPDGQFFIVTNCLPPRLRAYHDNNITGIYNVTKAKELEAFVADIEAA